MGADSSKERSNERERILQELREQEYRSRVHYSRAQEATQQSAYASSSNQNVNRNTATVNVKPLYPNLNQETSNTRMNSQNINYYDHYPNNQTNHLTNQVSGSNSTSVHANILTARPRPTISAAQSVARPPSAVATAAKASTPVATAAKAPSPMVAAAKAPSPMVAAAKAPSPMVAAAKAPSPMVAAAKAPSPMVAAAKAPSPMVAAAKAPSPMVAAAKAPSPMVAAAKAPSPMVAAAKAPSPMVAAAKAPSPMIATAKGPSPMVVAANAPSPNTVVPRDISETCQIGYLRLTPTAPPASDLPQKNILVQKNDGPKKVRNTRSKSASKTGNMPNSTPRSNNQNRNYEVTVTCCTCKGNFGLEIYQCEQGHSSCHHCKGRLCKDCRTTISDMRNFALEDYVAKLKAPCENNKEGCHWKISLSEMDSHLKECPFGNMACPVNNVIGSCSWKGKLSQLSSHLQENHQDVAFSDVDKEMLLPSICFDNKVVNFVELGNFRFIVHLQVCLETRCVYMTVQMMGPKKSAANWTYELHVYNKREPRRKFTFSDKCHGIATPLQEIISENDCAVLAIPLAMTYINEGAITYKFYITKSTKFNDNQCGGGARRKQPLDN